MAWETLVILAVAFGASVLTLFSGFGLGTILLPAFALAFPLDVAVAATAVVHLANNVAKGGLLGHQADRRTVLRFGIPACVAAFAGAALLLTLDSDPLYSYQFGRERHVSLVGLVIGSLVTVFAAFELVPALQRWRVGARHLPLGGAVSGFFGGLSGHQGALRSVFLTKLGFDARTFIATGTLCAILVDVSRLVVYSGGYAQGTSAITEAGGWWLLGGAVVMAIAGAVLGKRLLGSVTITGVRYFVGALLLILGPAIALGLA